MEINEAPLEATPQRITRSSSKPSTLLDKSTRTRLAKKPPLTFLKDPFSPQITEEQKQKMIELKEAEKRKPRKKYYVTKKVKSKRI